jgi:methylmalonyl-CoA mutase N-terminal domain/subunit
MDFYKVISSGHPGTEQAALKVAHSLGYKIGGTLHRPMKNVDNSDATLVFRSKRSLNVDKVIGYCIKRQWISILVEGTCTEEFGYRPVLVLDRLTADEVDLVRSFIIANKVRVLNVTGHQSLAFGESVERFLLKTLSFD